MDKCPFCMKPVSGAAEQCPECGAALERSGADWEQEVHALIAEGRTIEAIKTYREHTGMGLAEAKAAVEAMASGAGPVSRPEPGEDLEADVLRLLREYGKIQAIKFYREQTGTGLAEAKRAVEALAARHGALEKRSGCLGVLVVLAAAVVMGSLLW